jgi:hypothetical protein
VQSERLPAARVAAGGGSRSRGSELSARSSGEVPQKKLFRHDGGNSDVVAARADLQELHYRFRWPAPGPHGEYDNFFFGIWHPSARLSMTFGSAPVRYASVAGRNWMMAGAVSALHPGGASLVHAPVDDGGGVAFRGYVLGSNLHSCSASERILRYWQRDALAEHNGVYSAAVISPNGETLVLSADLFGMSPVYWARIGDAIIWSTNARYLVTAHAEPDRLAWRCLLETGFIAADRSLTRGVERLPAGKALRASRAGIELVTQYDYERMPAGTRNLDAGGIRDVELLFQTVMDRCLAVQDGELVLPLSSGHDSRRMLASLIDRCVSFDAVTCRVFHRGRDLDATYAAQMARDLGFPHRVVEPPPPARYAAYDVARRRLLDNETFAHTWALALNDALPARPCTLLDGLAGDILGNPGFRISTLYRTPREDVETMIDASVTDAFRRVLPSARWRGADDVRQLLRDYLGTLPQRVNLAEFAFILLRIRRSTALQALPFLPPGALVLFPFLDLDYVRLLFEFVPNDKHKTILQRRCLADFWPDYYRYPGTRDVPADATARPDDDDRETTLLCFDAVMKEIEARGGVADVRALLSLRGTLGFEAARRSRAAALRANWYCAPLTELVARELTREPCWERVEDATNGT